jgi:predicted ATPase
MINEISIQNFKCFQSETNFKFSKINLLTGINGRGKSSLLQAILLLSQSARKNENLNKLLINGEHLELGNYYDIKNSDTLKSEKIKFNLKLDSPLISDVVIQYEGNPDKPLIAELVSADLISKGVSIEVNPKLKKTDDLILTLASILKKVHFVSADRLGPVKYVDKLDIPDFLNVGPRGEYTINILSDYLNLGNVQEPLCLGNDAKHILQQTQEWLNYILEGGKIKIEGQEQSSSVLTMLLNNRNNSHAYKPANVGFGYSYILPLIVTGLVAKPGEIIIIENPEAHLHPRAQARISEFFSKVASCGIQVFIESHSEHILNGLRIGALNSNISLNYNELSIQYFSEDFKSEKLNMDEKGKIANWPHGFFDQQELDLSTIFKLSR